jgi:hypothetical protein
LVLLLSIHGLENCLFGSIFFLSYANWKHTIYRAGESVLLESMGVELAMDEI